MTFQEINKNSILTYLAANARPLDLALYNFSFDKGSKEAVIETLKTYQNPDGGFGKGIEPDFQLPNSSALGTTIAFQYLSKVSAAADDKLVREGVRYFLQTYNHQKHGWDIVPKEVGDYPHAPWWEHKAAMAGFGWGNPSAEILGYLLRYKTLVEDATILDDLTIKALERLRELATIDKPDFHELLCYMRLYEQADSLLQTQLYETLARLITKVVNLNPNDWKTYGATPLTFVKSSDSPFISLFDDAVIQANLDYLKQTIVDGNHWEPNWSWGSDYPDAWQQAKREWSGKLTVENYDDTQSVWEISMTKRILFIHRSCGANLLHQGHVRELLAQKNVDIRLEDYNQNKDTLTDNNGNQSFFKIDFVGNDTTPKAYADFFNADNEDSTILQRVLHEYDVVIIKSCYPNNAIKSDEELEELKRYYKAVANFFAKHSDKVLGIMTTPPLVQSKTNSDEANRARALATWLGQTKLGTNIRVFNFYDLLADKQTNTLRKEYQRVWAKVGIPDSHPNRGANKAIAVDFVDWLTTISN